MWGDAPSPTVSLCNMRLSPRQCFCHAPQLLPDGWRSEPPCPARAEQDGYQIVRTFEGYGR